MATEPLSRLTLNRLFSDGERPKGTDFAGAWLTFLSQKEDGISYDGKNLVISASTGITLGNPAGGPGHAPGTLRFNGTNVQYWDSGISDFKDIAGGAGAFLPVGAGPAVAFGLGNVGIGTFVAPPTHRLDVPLNDHADPATEILLGKLVIHTGPAGAKTGAYIGNNALANNAVGYALFQDAVGKTKINASNALNSGLSLAINDQDRLLITRDGDIQLSPASSIALNGNVTIGVNPALGVGRTVTITNITSGGTGAAALTVNGDASGVPTATPALVVNGGASKLNGGFWGNTSDRRVKKEIRPFNEGLQKILLFDPVLYKYNGKGGTIDNGTDYIGVIAQDVKKIMPEFVTSQFKKLNPEDTEEQEILSHDLSPLIFMFINAIKELNERVEKLEKSKKNAKPKAGSSSGTHN